MFVQDALRLYLINSPVVRAEPLRFKKDGVFAVVKYILYIWWHSNSMILISFVVTILEKLLNCFLLIWKMMILMQVKDVFLPWYNAYRFLVQNAKRLEIDGFGPFIPTDQKTLQSSSNVLDQWINSATQSLVHFVRQEMDAYRLYTVSFPIVSISNLNSCSQQFPGCLLKL